MCRTHSSPGPRLHRWLRFGEAALAIYHRQLHAAGVRLDPSFPHHLVAALHLLFAGTINWLGRVAVDASTPREEALGRNLLRNIARALSFMGG